MIMNKKFETLNNIIFLFQKKNIIVLDFFL